MTGTAPRGWAAVRRHAIDVRPLRHAAFRRMFVGSAVSFTAVVAGGPRLGDLRAGLTAAVTGPTVAWVGGGLAASVVAIALAIAFPSLVRYTSR